MTFGVGQTHSEPKTGVRVLGKIKTIGTYNSWKVIKSEDYHQIGE